MLTQTANNYKHKRLNDAYRRTERGKDTRKRRRKARHVFIHTIGPETTQTIIIGRYTAILLEQHHTTYTLEMAQKALYLKIHFEEAELQIVIMNPAEEHKYTKALAAILPSFWLSVPGVASPKKIGPVLAEPDISLYHDGRHEIIIKPWEDIPDWKAKEKYFLRKKKKLTTKMEQTSPISINGMHNF